MDQRFAFHGHVPMMARIAALAAGLVLASCGGSAPSAPSHVLLGTMTISQYQGSQQIIGGACTGHGGYDDIYAGTAVTVKDENSKILATGSLGGGTAPDRFSCSFPFKISNLPEAKFYQVEISHRGAVTYSREDLDRRGWAIQLSLG